MGASLIIGCQDQLVRSGGRVCTKAGHCCKESDKDFDVEHTGHSSGPASTMRLYAVTHDERGHVPIGLVLEESLEHLPSLDRQLLSFCGTSSLAAVRWLLHLSASLSCCDANGTTCLHTACRTGSTVVVGELLKQRSLLEAIDHAYWTPLHIAAHMGRPEVVARLLQSRASPMARNAWGHTPMQLCLNQATQSVFSQRPQPCSAKPEVEEEREPPLDGYAQDGTDQVEGEPEWWFINPEPAFRDTRELTIPTTELGVLIFNSKPTHGLAFMVAVGVADNYTTALHMLLADANISRSQVGNFLGESLSMCNAMRFGIFDAMHFVSTGVVTALITGFSCFKMPQDLEKAHRLVTGIALAWWRHHQYWLAMEAATSPSKQEDPDNDSSSGGGELKGLQLMQYLASCSALAQLMFSTLLLHWYIHRDGRSPKQPMSADVWMKLNKGIEHGGNDVPEHLQRRIHEVVVGRYVPSLDLSAAFTSDDEVVSIEGSFNQMHLTVLTPRAQLESEVQLLDDPVLGLQASPFRSSHGELSSVVFLGEQIAPSGAPHGSQQTICPGAFAMASLASAYLLFSPVDEDPGHRGISMRSTRLPTPSAVTDARLLCIEEADLITCEVILTSKDSDARSDCAEPVPRKEPLDQGIPVVHMLSDGRWQHVNISKLRIKFASREEVGAWHQALTKLVVTAPLDFAIV